MSASVTKSFEFEAGHNLEKYDGKCATPHGHSYKLEVTVQGPIAEDGMVMDFNVLDSLVKPMIETYLDHKYLNTVFGAIIGNPTAENLAHWIFGFIKKQVDDHFHMIPNDSRPTLSSIRLWETSKCHITITLADFVETLSRRREDAR